MTQVIIQLKKVQAYTMELMLEERAMITNWLLLSVTMGMSFGLITGSIAPIIFIALSPIIGWIAPNIFKTNSSNNVDTQNQSIFANTKIDSDKDNLWSAATKFILHTLTHIYILSNSTMIVISFLNLSPIAYIGFSCIFVTAIFLTPMILNECIQLFIIAQLDDTKSTTLNHGHSKGSLLTQMIIGLIAASAVFIATYYLCQWLIKTTILSLAIGAFIPPLMALTTLFVVGYGLYIYQNKEHLPHLSLIEVMKKIIAFLTLSIGSSWAIFKIFYGLGILQTGNLAQIGFFAAIKMTALTLGFPLLIILTCSTVICLSHTFNAARPSDTNQNGTEDNIALSTEPLLATELGSDPSTAEYQSAETQSLLDRSNFCCWFKLT